MLLIGITLKIDVLCWMGGHSHILFLGTPTYTCGETQKAFEGGGGKMRGAFSYCSS